MARLNTLNIVGYALWVTWMSALAGRSSLRGVPPEGMALMLRIALRVAPNVSDTLVAIQASGHWHQLFTTVLA